MAPPIRFVGYYLSHLGCVVVKEKVIRFCPPAVEEHITLSHSRPLAEVAFSQRDKHENK